MIYFSIFYLNLDKRVLGELIRKSARNQIIKKHKKKCNDTNTKVK